MENNQSAFILFKTEDEKISVDVRFEDETVWLTQDQMALLFGKAKSTINEHLDKILTMSGEQLLQGAGSISHEIAIEKATTEYKKYQQKTLSEAEKNYLDSLKVLENKTRNKHD